MPDATDPTEVAELMLTCVKKMRRVFDDRLAEHGLSFSRAKLLGALRDGACPQHSLAGHFDLAPRTVTELLDGLERRGLVERTVDPADRRARRVHLTPAGIEAHSQALAIRGEIFAAVLGPLGEARLGALVTSLREIATELDEH